METVDYETLAEAKRFIKEQHEAGKPFLRGGTQPVCISGPMLKMTNAILATMNILME
jgi:hypothetical protein